MKEFSDGLLVSGIATGPTRSSVGHNPYAEPRDARSTLSLRRATIRTPNFTHNLKPAMLGGPPSAYWDGSTHSIHV